MRILVLQGSFRKDKGITDIVVKRFIKGVQTANSQVEVNFHYLADKRIENCRGCLSCWIKSPGTCSIEDDMKDLIEEYKNSDIVIAATPMYVDCMSSYMKKFWERLLPVMEPYFEYGSDKIKHKMRCTGKKGLFVISTCAMPEIKQFDALVCSFERIAYNFDIEFLGNLLRPESHSVTYIQKYGDRINEVLSAIEKCGEELGRKNEVSFEALSKAQQSIMSGPDEFLENNNKMWDRVVIK